MVEAQGAERTIEDLGEDGLIAIFAAEPVAPGSKLIVANGDDAAAFMLEPQYASVITTDTLVEGVHFDFAYSPPLKVGRKLMAVNLSDIAAMGARPRYVLLSVTVPRSTMVETATLIADGIREQCRAHVVTVIGGNTTRTKGAMVLTATAIGRVLTNEILTRRGTAAGDALYVTGHIGDANAGLKLSRSGRVPDPRDPLYPLFSALVDPAPRIGAGRALAKTGLVHAMCDVSDGLGRDLRRLLGPEGLGARIDARSLPISAALRRFAEESGEVAELIGLEGGEDYELVFSADLAQEAALFEALACTETPLSRIGFATASKEIEVLMPDGSSIPLPPGYDHFRRGNNGGVSSSDRR